MTFILFLRFKNEARKHRKIFFGPIKKNGNKIATLAKMSHSYFYLDLKVHLTTFLYKKIFLNILNILVLIKLRLRFQALVADISSKRRYICPPDTFIY